MDLLIKGAAIADGTGGPMREGDVLVSGGRIVAVGGDCGDGGADTEVVNLDGLVLAPGFIDTHTHYDAQVMWDPDLTPSAWHGVTTVVLGNCGFGVAPTRPPDRETVIQTLANVEGMSPEALRAGVRWGFESFPQFLDQIRADGIRINVAAFIGHSSLRLFVLGPDQARRVAKPGEIKKMKDLVTSAMDAGALGFSTSRNPDHVGAEHQPVPSLGADFDEIVEIGKAVGDSGRGLLQLTARNWTLDDYSSLSVQTGAPVTYTALVAGMMGLMAPGESLEIADRAPDVPGTVWPQINCRPVVMQVTLSQPIMLGRLPSFREIINQPPDVWRELYRDPQWRERAAPELLAFTADWRKVSLQETIVHSNDIDRNLVDIAADRGVSPFDAFMDLSLEDDLQARFRFTRANDDEAELTKLLKKPSTVFGMSDAGAHADVLCDACFPTDLLGTWVRERGVLTIEEAVWRLSGQPADVLQLDGLGRIEPGAIADLVAFDPLTVAPGSLERVNDLPTGADRLVARGHGIHHMWVRGERIRADGVDIPGRRPGSIVSPLVPSR